MEYVKKLRFAQIEFSVGISTIMTKVNISVIDDTFDGLICRDI